MGTSAPDPWALSFDGVGDYVLVADDPALDLTSQVTLSAWVYPTGLVPGHGGVIQKDGPGSWGRYGLWIDGDEVEFCVYLASGSQPCLYSSSPLTLNTWTHVAGVYDGTEMRIYLNGVASGIRAEAGAISTSTEPLYVGGDLGDGYFIGQLDEVCVWSVARTQSEIQSTMSMRMMGTEPGLVGLWHMDDASGQIVDDATSNGLLGTLGLSIGLESSDPTWTPTTWPH